MRILNFVFCCFISAIVLGLMYVAFEIGRDVGRQEKGTWIKEVRTDTIYHFKPD